jgi:hypothetical protein
MPTQGGSKMNPLRFIAYYPSKQLIGFIFGTCFYLTIGSLPTIILDPIVSSIYFLKYGEWYSPINVEMVKFVTFRFDTSLLGLDLILNKILVLQTDTWGRIYLTGISFIFLILVGLLGLFLELKTDSGGTEYSVIENNWGFSLTHFSVSFLIFPGWFGGLAYCFIWFVKAIGIA